MGYVLTGSTKTISKLGLKNFSVVAPTLRNALPLYLRNIKSLVQFRKALKRIVLVSINYLIQLELVLSCYM